MYKLLEKQEAKEYYSRYYPKILSYWQKYGNEPRPMILKQLKINNKRVLDVGCGNGLILKELVKQNEVHGIDVSTKLLRQAKKIGIKTLYCNLDKKGILPYKKHHFDTILLFEVFEHVFSPKSLLEKCFRVLKPNGTIYMTIPNKSYPKRIEVIQKSLESALSHVYKKSIPLKAMRFPDVNILALNKIRKLLTTTGFRIKKIYGWCWELEGLNPKERQRLWLNPLKASDLLIVIKRSKQ